MFTLLSLLGVGALATAAQTILPSNDREASYRNGYLRPLAFDIQAAPSQEQQLRGREKRVRVPRSDMNNGLSGKRKPLGMKESGPVIAPGYFSSHDYDVLDRRSRNSLVEPGMGYARTAWRNSRPIESRIARSLPRMMPGIANLKTPVTLGTPMSPYVRDPTAIGEFGTPHQISSSGYVARNGVHTFFKAPGQVPRGHFTSSHTPCPLPQMSTRTINQQAQAERRRLCEVQEGIGAELDKRIAIQIESPQQRAKIQVDKESKMNANQVSLMRPMQVQRVSVYQ